MPFGFTRGHSGKHKHKHKGHLKPSEVLAKAAEKKEVQTAAQEAMKANLKVKNGIKKGFKERQKARKAKIESSGKVIGGKLRGAEGIADIAFLEWLVPKGSMNEHALWTRYLEDYNIEVPYEMVPRTAVRPANLKTQLNEVSRRRAQYKEEVKKGREKIEGLAPSESVLDYIKRTEKSKPGGSDPRKGLTKTEQMKAAFAEGEGMAAKSSAAQGKAGSSGSGNGGNKSLSVKEIRKKTKSSNPFDLLMGL